MPDLSIVIPVFNCLELTRACHASLEETIGQRDDFEVIFVDDGSTDGTRDWLAALPTPRYRVLINETNRGYAASNNAAAKIAAGRNLLLLNNDTVLLPGWLEPMLRVLERAPRAGVVGNVQREAETGLIDHAGVQFTLDGQPVHADRDSVLPPESEYQARPAVTGACCAIRRDVYHELGGLDERFRNGFEDIDLCLRARAAGFQNYVANRSIIYHHVSASPGRKDNETRNFALFLDRWGSQISARRERHLAREDGWRYLHKHRFQPWRYNARRLRQALRGIMAAQPGFGAENFFE